MFTGSAQLLRTLSYAARQHQDQRKRGYEALPYLNHVIAVADALAREGGVYDLPTLQAALLHDCVEDTNSSYKELQGLFGEEVADLVEELTDDMSLPYEERKRLQVAKAPKMSAKARVIKVADQLCNVRDIANFPLDWPRAEKLAYLDWAGQIIQGLVGSNAALEQRFWEEVPLIRATIG